MAAKQEGTNTTEQKGKEREYSVNALEKKSMELFGISKSTFAGAFYKQDKEKKYTIAQAKDIIDRWKKGEVH